MTHTLQRNQLDDAERCYTAKMSTYKEGAFYRTVTQFNLARVLNKKGEPQRALENLEEVIKVSWQAEIG